MVPLGEHQAITDGLDSCCDLSSDGHRRILNSTTLATQCLKGLQNMGEGRRGGSEVKST